MNEEKKYQEGTIVEKEITLVQNNGITVRSQFSGVAIFFKSNLMAFLNWNEFSRVILGDTYINDTTSRTHKVKLNYKPRFNDKNIFSEISIEVFLKGVPEESSGLVYLPEKNLVQLFQRNYGEKFTWIASRNEFIKERYNDLAYTDLEMFRKLDYATLQEYKSMILSKNYLNPIEYINNKSIKPSDLYIGVKNSANLVSLLFGKVYYNIDKINMYVQAVYRHKDELEFTSEEMVKLESIMESIKNKKEFLDKSVKRLIHETSDDKTNLF